MDLRFIIDENPGQHNEASHSTALTTSAISPVEKMHTFPSTGREGTQQPRRPSVATPSHFQCSIASPPTSPRKKDTVRYTFPYAKQVASPLPLARVSHPRNASHKSRPAAQAPPTFMAPHPSPAVPSQQSPVINFTAPQEIEPLAAAPAMMTLPRAPPCQFTYVRPIPPNSMPFGIVQSSYILPFNVPFAQGQPIPIAVIAPQGIQSPVPTPVEPSSLDYAYRHSSVQYPHPHPYTHPQQHQHQHQHHHSTSMEGVECVRESTGTPASTSTTAIRSASPPRPPAVRPATMSQALGERILVQASVGAQKNNLKPKTRQFTCQECGRSFFRKSDLVRHVPIHLGIKPNACKICGKQFLQRSALTVHIRVHTGEKPYNCNFCGRAFSDSSSLARHRRIHMRKQEEAVAKAAAEGSSMGPLPPRT